MKTPVRNVEKHIPVDVAVITGVRIPGDLGVTPIDIGIRASSVP